MPDNPPTVNRNLELLRQFVAGSDVFCPLCDYNLRDLTNDRCPECGEQLVLKVNTSEPRQAWLITGLIGLAAGAGLSGLLLFYAFIRLVLNGDSFPGMRQFITITGCGFVIEGITVLIWLKMWRQIRQGSQARQILLAIGCWGLTIANLLFFTLHIK